MNFSDPNKLDLGQPEGQKHPPLKSMDGYRAHPCRDPSTPDLFFLLEEDSKGHARGFKNPDGSFTWLIQLWWIQGNGRVLVQRNYLLNENTLDERGWVLGGYNGK